MYVSEICAEGIFVTFPWWLKNVKSRSKIALFWNKRHFEIWFPKKRSITFFWSILSKLHKKDPILHVATAFSLKQGETRTRHGPIPHPLTWCNDSLIKTLSYDTVRPEFQAPVKSFSLLRFNLNIVQTNFYQLITTVKINKDEITSNNSEHTL